MRTFVLLTRANLLTFFRDRAALFWALAFPLIFILLFGAIFSGAGTTKSAVGVVDLDGTPASQALAPTVPPEASPSPSATPTAGAPAFGSLSVVFNLTHYPTEADATAAMRDGKVSAVIVIPKGFGASVAAVQSGAATVPLMVDVYVDRSNQTEAATIMGIVSSMVDGVNLQATGRPPVLVPDFRDLQSGGLSATAYLVPSILAMALMQGGLFSAIPIVEQRQNLILKRLSATPIRRRTFVAAAVVGRLVVALIQAVVLLIVAQLVFQIALLGSPLVFAGLVLLGSLAFIALGYVVAAFAPTEDAASQMTSVLQFPLMFLSGIFFPLNALPDVLRGVATLMPLTYLGDALRQVMVSAPAFLPLGVDALVITGWLVACFAVAARFFRWT
jgi:ABC-2 type transport system permease protein